MTELVKKTFAERCTLSEQCLPDAPYRAMLTKLHVEMQAEIERLNKALTWEQNRSERIGTHAPGCHTWGPAHYECLLRVNTELVEALKEITCDYADRFDLDDPSTNPGIKSSIKQARAALAKATGETK